MNLSPFGKGWHGSGNTIGVAPQEGMNIRRWLGEPVVLFPGVLLKGLKRKDVQEHNNKKRAARFAQ